jgi:transcriptional regulator with XRE-family HTH domain
MALLDVARSKEGERSMAEETFGKRLKRLREQIGLTQQQLADQTKTHRITIVKLEQDVYGPTWATVQALAKALGVGCSAFEGTAEPAPEDATQPRKRGRPRKAAPTDQPEPPAGEAAPDGEGKAKRKRGK